MFKTKNTEKKTFKNCHNCLKSNCIELIDIKGSVLPYLKVNIRVPVSVILIGCAHCGEYILGPGDCEMLDDVCKYTIKNHPDHVQN